MMLKIEANCEAQKTKSYSKQLFSIMRVIEDYILLIFRTSNILYIFFFDHQVAYWEETCGQTYVELFYSRGIKSEL